MSAFQSEFTYKGAPVRVQFAPGIRAQAGAVMKELGLSRALVLSTPEQSESARTLADTLGSAAIGSFTGARMHTPVGVSEEATKIAQERGADCVIAVGGGSTIGLGKAIAYRTDLPQIVIPTTYAGSEATPILGQTEDGVKTTLSDPRVLPEVILYDAELVCSLPPAMTVTSALNAIAHAAEALYAQNRHPIATLMAREGMAAFAAALPRVLENPDDLSARGETLYGAWLCGTVLGQVGMALHHKLCHTLGGTFDLPHAETHAILLPHAVAFNAQAVPDLLRPVAEIFGQENAGQALWGFAKAVGAPMALRDLGMSEADLDKAADLAMARPYWNPRPLERDAIRALLQRASDGQAPAA